MEKANLNVVGIMSGTSIDGVDFVLCKVNKDNSFMRLLSYASTNFTDELKDKLFRAANHNMGLAELAELHHELGRFYAFELKKIVKSKKWKFDLIGIHGQTVYHNPPTSTLQIGEPSYLKVTFNVPVVSDFRPLDLAAGGQGAPIASLFHVKVLAPAAKSKLLLNSRDGVAIQNIGGISNVTYVKSNKVISAFDTGPGNMLIDLVCSNYTNQKITYDLNGNLASAGVPIPNLIEQWIKHDFFNLPPPKSCGREQFGITFLNKFNSEFKGRSLSDILATVTEFTAISIYTQYARFNISPRALIICGGGSKNLYLLKRLRQLFDNTKVITSNECGWPSEAVEGAAFGLLAAMKVWNKNSNLPATTGAKLSLSLGKIT